MNDLRDLYQQLILDHCRNPRNFGELSHHTHTARGYNPLCGDQCCVELHMDGDVVTDIKFHGDGCAISKASASLMTAHVKGRTASQVQQAFDSFHTLVTSDASSPEAAVALGKLSAFAGVREFPMRVKCATLAWHTLRAAMRRESEAVCTE